MSDSQQEEMMSADLSRPDTGTAHIARVYDYWLGGPARQEAAAVAAMWGGVAVK